MDKKILNKTDNIFKLCKRRKEIERTLNSIESEFINTNSGGFIRLYPQTLKDIDFFISFELDKNIINAIHKVLSAEKENIETIITAIFSNIPTDKPTK